MGKIKISPRQKTLSKKQEKELRIEDFEGAKENNPSKRLTDPKFIGAAVMECLLNNDPEGAMEMIEIYLNAIDRVKLRKKTNLHKTTLHSVMKHRNPTIKTLAKIMYSYSHNEALEAHKEALDNDVPGDREELKKIADNLMKSKSNLWKNLADK